MDPSKIESIARANGHTQFIGTPSYRSQEDLIEALNYFMNRHNLNKPTDLFNLEQFYTERQLKYWFNWYFDVIRQEYNSQKKIRTDDLSIVIFGI